MKTSACRVARRAFHGGINSAYRVPDITNEPLLDYAPGSAEREDLVKAIERMSNEQWDIPAVIDGKAVMTGDRVKREIPHENKKTLCTFQYGTKEALDMACSAALNAKKEWENMPFQHRAAIWLKAADLMAGKYRADLLASTMLGQSKTVWQAEIDAAVESIDFLRYDVKYAEQLYQQQPVSAPNTWNFSEYRPLEGFCLAITPFNFTAIGIHLPTAPALMGNTVVWKCSDAAVHSNYLCLKIMEEAGLPAGVINFVPSDPSLYNDYIIPNPDLAAVAFTGSTRTFSNIWKHVGNHIEGYKSYPRLIGECGGKNFHLVHESADMESVICGTIRGAFEYQGQKCSATSRMYVPKSVWEGGMRDKMCELTSKLYMGNVHKDMKTFMGAVIDERAFRKIKGFIDGARSDPTCKIVTGGVCDDSEGWFVQPTIIETTDPHTTTMKNEIFGPVLTVYPYDDAKFDEMPALIDSSTPYSLTGSLFAQDRKVINEVSEALKNSTGNFYVNDKSTGSIVAQQPFGGARGSGTNDKAGSSAFMGRWVSARSVKETFIPLRGIDYPSMA
eukprot:TRINITY_DN426_c0_g1_i1.p1 TRINITY_DN426_c0_g1~~TRINITY_DN426_c0_g1_i1.p1  ORF type:complete len:559 (+),score=246.74 TRINITY_DN426_c0_g1_i1:56-1732(+)